MNKIVKAIYVSVWDDSIEIESSCNFNPQTNEVSDIEQVDTDALDINSCTREYVRLMDGSEIDIDHLVLQ